jgi:adenylate cyclase
MTCAACGFEAAADFAFCPKCGAKLAAAPASDVAVRPVPVPSPSAGSLPDAQSDRRPVTVLFADLSGFTALSERLDPEDVRALQGDLFKEMSRHRPLWRLRRKFVGDAIGCVRCARHHETIPAGAALALMRDRVAVSASAGRHRLAPGAIGVNAGPVVTGQLPRDQVGVCGHWRRNEPSARLQSTREADPG